jgi:hypothetical protein
MFLQSLVDPRDCSSVVTAFNDTTGGLNAMEIAKMVQKLHDCTNAKSSAQVELMKSGILLTGPAP